MDAFICLKQIGGANECKSPMVVAIVVALTISISISNLQHVYAAIPDEAVKTSAPAKNEIAALSEHIKQLVRGLEYSDKVAEDFVEMVRGWEDSQGEPVLAVWNQRLNQARQDYRKGKISKTQFAEAEQVVVKELNQWIWKEIDPDLSKTFFELADVVKHRQAQCVGYSQLFYVLGSCIDLSIKTIYVQEAPTGKETDHMTCIVFLEDGATAIVDINFVSKPFVFEKEFRKVGHDWKILDIDNPFQIPEKIRIYDKMGLIAFLHLKRGHVHKRSGQFLKAISEYNKAIEVCPIFPYGYVGRGTVQHALKDYGKAITDYTKAIELDSYYALAYSNRASTYFILKEYKKGISDSTRAIELDPNFAPAYYVRGNHYQKLKEYIRAISDYTKAIELDPDYALAYDGRASTYFRLREYKKGMADCTSAIELDPNYAPAYFLRAGHYQISKEYTKAVSDYTKIIQLDAKNVVKYSSYFFRGRLYLKLKEYKKAIYDLTKTIEINPKNAEAYFFRGLSFAYLEPEYFT